MARAASPTLRRREVAARLRQLRLEQDLTVEQVAESLLVSPSKISRLETANRPASARDVRDLCRLYKVPDAERDRLLRWNRESKEPGWWEDYDLPEVTREYIGLETAANVIMEYQASWLPGLLQTEDYARALVAGVTPLLSVDSREHRVRARVRRRELLTDSGGPTLRAVIDEACLHRVVGGRSVMRSQLDDLVKRARLPNVVLQVVPFSSGAHPGMGGSFVVLELDGDGVSDVAYEEGVFASEAIHRGGDVERYREAFLHIQSSALSESKSLEAVRGVRSALD